MPRDYLSVLWKIDELRLVADTTKHAEGKSSGDLRMLRADLFFDPTLARMLAAPDQRLLRKSPRFRYPVEIAIENLRVRS